MLCYGIDYIVQDYLPELLETEEGTAAAQAHTALQTSLQAFVSTTHAEWFHGVQPDVVERLKKPLLKQVAYYFQGPLQLRNVTIDLQDVQRSSPMSECCTC